MPVPEKLKDSLDALKRKVNQESELFTALNNLSAKNSTASSPVTTIDEDEIMEVIGKEESISRIKKGIELLSK